MKNILLISSIILVCCSCGNNSENEAQSYSVQNDSIQIETDSSETNIPYNWRKDFPFHEYDNNYPCHCYGKESKNVKEEFDKRDLLFEGEMIKLDTVWKEGVYDAELGEPYLDLVYVFKPYKIYKGHIDSNTVTIVSGSINYPTCNFIFQPEKRYAIFADLEPKSLQDTSSKITTNKCTFSSELNINISKEIEQIMTNG